MKPRTKVTRAQAVHFRKFLAASVHEYREKHQLSVEQFAARSGLSASKIRGIENVTYDVNTTELFQLSAALECTASQLLRAGGI